jgi:hypothetical protein
MWFFWIFYKIDFMLFIDVKIKSRGGVSIMDNMDVVLAMSLHEFGELISETYPQLDGYLENASCVPDVMPESCIKTDLVIDDADTDADVDDAAD